MDFGRALRFHDGMKTTLALLLCLAAPLAAESLTGSGTVKTETRTLTAYTAIDAGGALELTITCGKDLHCEVTADDNLLPAITTAVEGDTLKIGTNGSISTSSGIKIALSVPDLHKLTLSGAGKVALTGVKNDALALNLTGATNVTASGRTHALTIEISGAGKIAADDLKADDATVICSGTGAVDVSASGTLTATVSGVGRVRYSGDPKSVQKHVSGVGSVSPR